MKVKFVNRVQELNYLRKLAEEGFYPTLYIYGPEGCGKTRLLKELYNRLQKSKDTYIIYVDATAREGRIEDIVLSNIKILPIIEEAISKITPIGKAIALAIPHITRRLIEKYSIKGKHIVIIVDDIAKPLGINEIELYAKNLLNLIEYCLDKGAKSCLIIASTSEGISRSILLKHNYTSIETLWNLPREAHDELALQLKAPKQILEELWYNTGGNPRAIIELKYRRWNIKDWLEKYVKRKIRELLKHLSDEERSQLEETLENIDKVAKYRTLQTKLLDYNLISPIDRPCLGYTPPVDPELGIGEYYAWQIPAYKHTLTEIIGK